jgi:hypothetical protein
MTSKHNKPHESVAQYLVDLKAATQRAVNDGAPASGITEFTLMYAGSVLAKFGPANDDDSVSDLVETVTLKWDDINADLDVGAAIDSRQQLQAAE